jgi:hypothetical protein
MRVFLCWSGTRSRGVAAALKQFLLDLNEALPLSAAARFDPFMSADIEKGATWFEAIGHELQSTDAALLSVTPENAASAWMHFEAGAIATQLTKAAGDVGQVGSRRNARLFTYLFGLEPKDLQGPLSAYQSTVATQADTRALVRQLTDVQQHAASASFSGEWNEQGFRNCWNTFAGNLRRVRSQPFTEAVPGFEQLFQRKTFQEPLPDCHRQAWMDRLFGCHDVLENLREALGQVKRGCRPAEAALLQQVMASLDAYAMAMSAYLVHEERFPLNSDGRLELPAGAEKVCEDRRRAIKDAVAALLDPARTPVFEESPAFEKLETFAEKKHLIHRKTADIRRWIRVSQDSDIAGDNPKVEDWRLMPTLPECGELEMARMSVWDFDRVIYYVAHSECVRRDFDPSQSTPVKGILAGTELEQNVCAWLEEEIQRIRASVEPKISSRMPLGYCLGVLEDMHAKLVSAGRALQPDLASRVAPLLKEVIELEEGLNSQVRQRCESLLAQLRT